MGSRAGVHLRGMIIVAVGGSFSSLSVARVLTSMLFGGSKENRVVGVGLDVLLQVLRTLEGLSAEVAFVWLERDVYSDVGGDMVALDSGGTAGVPTAGKVQVVGALPADMFLADVLKEGLCRCASLAALVPLAGQVVVRSDCWARDLSSSCGGRFLVCLLLSRHSCGRAVDEGW